MYIFISSKFGNSTRAAMSFPRSLRFSIEFPSESRKANMKAGRSPSLHGVNSDVQHTRGGRWDARDYLFRAGELTTNHRWENRLPVERTARSLTTSLLSFNGHSNGTSSPRDAN